MFDIRFLPNPNAKALTLLTSEDLLGPFGKVSIPLPRAKDDNSGKIVFKCTENDLAAFSPLAQHIGERTGGVSRVDFAWMEQNGIRGTTISLISPLPWDVSRFGGALNMLNDFFKGSNQPAIYLEELKEYVDPLPAFEPKDDLGNALKYAWEKEALPLMAKDGGAGELIRTSLDANGLAEMHILLLGSCSGCSSATEKTLAEIANRAMDVVDTTKKRPDAQGLKSIQNALAVKVIPVESKQHVVILRAQDARQPVFH